MFCYSFGDLNISFISDYFVWPLGGIFYCFSWEDLDSFSYISASKMPDTARFFELLRNSFTSKV